MTPLETVGVICASALAITFTLMLVYLIVMEIVDDIVERINDKNKD